MSRLGCVLLFLVLTLTGCATPNTIRLMDGGKDGRVVREIGIDPVMFSGLPWSDDLKQGNFVTLLGNFPQTPESYAEWDPLRIRYQAHAVGTDGKEYVAHALFAGYIQCQPRFFVFVEGLRKPTSDVKVVTLSTLLDRAYGLDGRPIKTFDRGKFQSDAKYRQELVSREGTALTAVRQIGGMERAFENWTVYQTKSGLIATPLDPQRVRFLSGINPQYSYWEKVVGTTRGAVSLDYIGTSLNLVIELIQAGSADSKGFDYASVMSRKQQGYNLVFMEALRTEGQRSCMTAIAAERRKP